MIKSKIITGTTRDYLEFDRHEKVVAFTDNNCDLTAFISIHNTKLGPATGGTRIYDYATQEDAINDSLRLSKAMSYKCALAKVPFGGGKGVIIGNKTAKTEALLKAYGKAVYFFNGEYTTGTDVGITDEDTSVMASTCKYILGQKDKDIEKLNTSKMASLGVYNSIKPCLKYYFDEDSIEGKSFAIKGLGKIGLALIELLKPHNPKIFIADIDKNQIKKALGVYPSASVVSSDEIHKLDVDVYMPCALGNEFTPDNISELKCKIILGGANNQLSNKSVGYELFSKNILYTPDYVVNAGGLINIVDELHKGGYNMNRVLKNVEAIASTVTDLLNTSKISNRPPFIVADEIAEQLLYDKRH